MEYHRVDLPRALFEAPTKVSQVQKNLIADKHSVSKPVQSKPAPRDAASDKDETEEVNPVTDETAYKFTTLLGDELETVIELNEDEIDDGNLATSGGTTCPEPQRALS